MAKLKKLLLSGLATSAALGMLFASDATVAQAAESTDGNEAAQPGDNKEGDTTPTPGTEPIETPSDGNAGTGETDPNPEDKKVDKTELETAIKKAEEAKETVKYSKATDSVKQQFDDALKQAKEAFESEDSEKAQIEDLAKRLNDATGKLNGKDESTEPGEGEPDPEQPGTGETDPEEPGENKDLAKAKEDAKAEIAKLGLSDDKAKEYSDKVDAAKTVEDVNAVVKEAKNSKEAQDAEAGENIDWSQYQLEASKDPNNPLKKPAGQQMDLEKDSLLSKIHDKNAFNNKGPKFHEIKGQIKFEIVKNLPADAKVGEKYSVEVKATFPDQSTQTITFEVLVTQAEGSTDLPEKEEFKVTFHQNYENKVNVTRTVKKDQKVTALDLKREGYNLVGWYTDEEMTQKFDFDTPITADLDLYAKWEKAEEEVKIDKTALKQAIEKADAEKETVKYQKASEEKKNNFDKAYQKAEEVAKDETAKQEAVNEAAEQLVAATEALDGKEAEQPEEKKMADEYKDKVKVAPVTVEFEGKVSEETILNAVTVEGLERKQPTRAAEEKWYSVAIADGENLPDGQTAGEFSVKVVVTFSDGSKTDVTVNVTVKAKEETTADKFGDKIQIRQGLSKKQGEKVTVEDIRKVIGKPVNMTDDEWAAAVAGLEITKNLDDEVEVGDRTVKVKFTFSDQSTVEKDIPVKVEAKEDEGKQLEEAKENAKKEIAELDLSDDKAKEYNDKVDEAETVEAVQAVVKEAKDFKEAQDAEAAQALKKAKEDAKNEIYKLNLGEEKIRDYTTRINEAKSIEEVNEILEEAKKSVDNSQPGEGETDPDEKKMSEQYIVSVDDVEVEFGEKVTEEAILKAVTVEGLDRKEEESRAAAEKWYSVALAEGQKLPDGQTAGTFKVKVVVTFSDGSTTEKTVDVTVKEKANNNGDEGETPEPSEDKALALEVQELDKWVKYADSLKKMTIDAHNALDEAKAVLAKENKTYAEVHAALEKLFFALEDANLLPKTGDEGQEPGEGSGEETPNKPGKDWNDLIDWDKLEDLLGKGEEGQKPGTGDEETEKPGQGNEGEKPGTGGEETEKPAKDWLELIDWDKVKELLAKKGDKKPGKQEEVKTGKKEEAKKGKKEEAKKLPQTGAVASLGSAALGLALTTLGAGFAFRKRQ